MNFLNDLNEVQQQAVKAVEGPIMLIAGPGSGKTRVLTYRIAHLMESGIDPFNILALTFTNKAAKEMRERIEKVVGTEARNLWMGTFHSVFARILRYESNLIGYPSNFTIYDTDDSKSLIKTIVKELELNDKQYKPNAVQYRISNAKNSLISASVYAKDEGLLAEDVGAGRPRMAEIYTAYAKRCFQAGAMDFDDLLFKTYELLNKHMDVLYKYQDKFKFILVDEYQDTNYAQYVITKDLAALFKNICVVGDDAQSIYSFRGANIRNILNFEKDYPGLKTFKLEQNYRSTKQIVKAANTVIKNNRQQLTKEIWTDNGQGEPIKVVKCISDNEEGKLMAEAIFEMKMRKHYYNRDFAILYRTNAQSRSFEEALRRLNIPYRIYGGLSFYMRKEIKDILAYLKLTVNHLDEQALRRIINYPRRGIGKTTLEKATILAKEKDKPLWEILLSINSYEFGAKTKMSVNNFMNMIRSFATMLENQDAYSLALHIAKSTGILRELHNDKTVEGISRYENLHELLNGIKEFTEQDVVENDTLLRDKTLGSYLQEITLLTNADDDPENDDQVKLMTIHAAKGLEFPCVIVGGLEENLFPSMMSLTSRQDLEEERRLFYVAITRAEKHLILAFATSRYRFGSLQYCEPSRFIEEMPTDCIEFLGAEPEPKVREPQFNFGKKQGATNSGSVNYMPPSGFKPHDTGGLQPGMKVEHHRFGAGKVLEIEGSNDSRLATIEFSAAGSKRIMLKYAKLRIV